MVDLFAKEDGTQNVANDASRPLADRLRPKTLDEIIGQDHVVGSDAP